MKQKFFILLALVCCGMLYSQNFTFNGINYAVLDANFKTAQVVANPSATGNLIIPDFVDFNNNVYGVKFIADNAFSNCAGLTSVFIPFSIGSLGSNVFSGCSSLVRITIDSEYPPNLNSSFAGFNTSLCALSVQAAFGSGSNPALNYTSSPWNGFMSVVACSPIIFEGDNSGANQNDGIICVGGSASLSAINGNSYLWSPGGQTSSSITVSPTSTTNYTVTVTTNGCGVRVSARSIGVIPNNTITLTSAVSTNSQTKCVNTAIASITYNTTTATGATFTGLPAGVTGTWNSNIVTISGTPTVAGTYNYTVAATGGCAAVNARGTITVNQPAPNITYSNVSPTYLTNTPITALTPTNSGGTPVAGTLSTNSSNFSSVLGSPFGIAVDASNNVYVGNDANGIVSKITPAGVQSTISTFSAGNTALGLSVDAAGNVYAAVKNANEIRKITAVNASTTIPGTYAAPISVAFHQPSGALFVADLGNSAIKKVDNAGVVTTIASGLSAPTGVAADAAGNVYVANRGNSTIVKIDINNAVTTLVDTGLNAPQGIAVDANGNIFVGNTGGGNVVRITGFNTFVTVANGFNQPVGIGFDTLGNMYVADYSNSVVKKIVLANYTVSPVLPAGLSFNATNGTISGTPTAATAATTYTISAQNSCGTSSTTVRFATCASIVTPTFTQVAPICAGATLNALPTSSTNSPAITGIWSPALNNQSTTTYTFTPAVGQCATTATMTIVVNPVNTMVLLTASSNGIISQSGRCVNSPINTIRYSTTGATGATFTGFPAGVTGTWNNNEVTISGTPTVSGTFACIITLTGGCGTVSVSGNLTINPNTTFPLTSAVGTDTQTTCINTVITNISYSFSAPGATCAGLPAGVTANISANVVIISGTPTVAGTYNYTVKLDNRCSAVTGTITVNPLNTLVLLTGQSGGAFSQQDACANSPIKTISYSTTNATGATFSGFPPGVTTTWNNNEVTISGTATVSGTFACNVMLTGGCGSVGVSGNLLINPNTTFPLTSAVGTDAQTTCINAVITNIWYTTSGSIGAIFSNLPAGVTGNWSSNVVTISGTPTTAGIYNYTVKLRSECKAVTGTITVNAINTIALSSAVGTNAQNSCSNSPITNITYTTTGATAATFSGLPTGVSGAWNNNLATISGTPTVAGTFNYSVNLTGGCGIVNATGTIIVNALPTVSAGNPPTAVCPGTTVTLNGSASLFSSGFTGSFAPSNWTFTNNNANGTLNTTAAPNSITINRNSYNSSNSGDTKYSINVPSAGTISFSWSFNTTSDLNYDLPLFRKNGIFTLYNNYSPSGSNNQSGTMTIAVNNGEEIAFYNGRDSSTTGTNSMTISNFTFVSATNLNWTTTNGTLVGATNGLSATASAPGTYTLTATAANGCTKSSNVVVTYLTPTTPIFTQVAPVCEGTILAALPLTSTNGISGTWSPSFDNQVTTTHAFTPNSGQCAVGSSMTVNVISTTAPTAASNQTFCSGEPLSNIAVSGTGIVWYDAATAGTILPSTTLIQSGTTYYASQTANGCESIVRKAITMTNGACLGNQNFDEASFSYHPNPTNGILNVNYSSEIYKVEVTNMLGQNVLVQKTNSKETQIDMQFLPAGTYLVKIYSEDKTKIIKIVKN